MQNSFWQQFIQPERRLHIRETIREMLEISALLYGGVAISGIISLSLPVWPELDKGIVYIVCLLGLIMSVGFYSLRNSTPLWLVVVHAPIGVALASVVAYAGHAPQSIGLATVYMLGALYAFHYFTWPAALCTIGFAMFTFGYVLFLNNVTGWLSITFFLACSCVLLGEIIQITVKRLNKLAVHDSLTGLYNRNTLDALVTEGLNTDEAPDFTLVMLDLNKFKHVNDTEGHIRGDEILTEVGLAISSVLSANDYACRWGGDEFIIIMQGSDKSAVTELERKLRNILKYVISFEMGASFAKTTDTLDSMIKRADENMYAKKRNRRASDIAAA